MDNSKLILKENQRFGKGVFAKEEISQGELIAVWDGGIYEAEMCSDLPNNEPLTVRDHAIQFEEHKWKDSKGLARYINHSCEPNCGIKNLFDIVAMRNVAKDEEITWDYDMTENSNWQMECKCGTQSCRKIIRGFQFLPNEIKNKYQDYISDWLKH